MSEAVSDEHFRIDIAAMDVPSPSFPVRNFELDSVELPEAVAASPEPASADVADFEVPDFKATDEALEATTSAENRQRFSKPASIYTFDAVARLEELLSGCRVQPHWTTEKRSESQEQEETPENAVSDGAFMRLDDEHHLPDEDHPLEKHESATVPTSDEILQRSGEIAGLVDQLIATLDDEDDSQPVSELRFDVPEKSGQSAQPRKSAVDDDARNSPTASNETKALLDSSGLQLRFDQIDISEKFSQPLYQPHQPSDADEVKVSVRMDGKSQARQQLELEIGRNQPVQPTADQLAVDSGKPQAARSTKQTGTCSGSSSDLVESTGGREEKTTESLIHVVQRGHDEALRHLLHHLREIEERVRE